MLWGCANQEPPSGGDDDRTPPRIVSIDPRPNTTNFRGNKISIEFNEYVDRRSFEESVFISPRPKEYRVNFSGDGAKIEFPQGLEPNRTYSITVTRDLKDLRGGNKITEPLQFAISTGSVIDKGKISGKVYSTSKERLVILGYILGSSEPDPTIKAADLITQADNEGNYSFQNLPPVKIRLFALLDRDRNQLLDEQFEEIGVLSQDYMITDTVGFKDVDFLMMKMGIDPGDKGFTDSLPSIDTLDLLHSSISEGERGVPIDNRSYFYFKNSRLSRQEIADNLSLRDTVSNTNVRIVYNWMSDSLLQIFPQEKLRYSTSYRFVFDLNNTAANYYNTLNFRTIEESNTGNVKGNINFGGSAPEPVLLRLINTAKPFFHYDLRAELDSTFAFSNIPEGNYTLFGFIDSNGNGIFDRGRAVPFQPSERSVIYSPEINLRGSWTVDNVFLNF